MYPRPSGYEPDELPGCSTPRQFLYNNPAATSVKLSCVFPPALHALLSHTDTDGLMPLRRIPRWIASRLRHRDCSLVAAFLLLFLAAAAPLAAQGLGRHLKAEANASLSFGNVDQATTFTRLGASSVDSTLEADRAMRSHDSPNRLPKPLKAYLSRCVT